MFHRYCRVIHGEERKSSGKQLYYATIAAALHAEEVEDEDAVGYPLLGDLENCDFDDVDDQHEVADTETAETTTTVKVLDSGRGKRVREGESTGKEPEFKRSKK